MFAVTVEWLRMCGRGSSCLSRSEAKKVQQWAPGPAPPTRLVTVRGSILPNRDRVIHPASMSQPSNLDADPASPSMRGTKTPRSHWTTRRWISTFQKRYKQRQQESAQFSRLFLRNRRRRDKGPEHVVAARLKASAHMETSREPRGSHRATAPKHAIAISTRVASLAGKPKLGRPSNSSDVARRTSSQILSQNCQKQGKTRSSVLIVDPVSPCVETALCCASRRDLDQKCIAQDRPRVADSLDRILRQR